MPPAGKNHTYYFLLYKQAIPLGGITITGYVGQHCQERYKNFVDLQEIFQLFKIKKNCPLFYLELTVCFRCHFEINRFVADYQLKLSGARWMIAHNDAYVRHLYVTERGMDEHAVCHGITGFPANCHESVIVVGKKWLILKLSLPVISFTMSSSVKIGEKD